MEYLPTLLLVAVFFGLWWKRDREWARASLVALAIFVLALFPILGFLPAIYMKNYSYVADHWQYVALVAPVALAVSAAARWLHGEWVRRGAAAVVLAVLAALTFQHAIIHRSPKALWTHNLTVTDSWFVRHGMSLGLAQEGRTAEALVEARRAVDHLPSKAELRVNLGSLLEKLGRHGEAETEYRRALGVDGGNSLALNAMAFFLATRPGVSGGAEASARASEAIGLARMACAITNDEDPYFLDTLAAALAASGDYPTAVATADRALTLVANGQNETLAEEIREHRALFLADKPLVLP